VRRRSDFDVRQIGRCGVSIIVVVAPATNEFFDIPRVYFGTQGRKVAALRLDHAVLVSNENAQIVVASVKS